MLQDKLSEEVELLDKLGLKVGDSVGRLKNGSGSWGRLENWGIYLGTLEQYTVVY